MRNYFKPISISLSPNVEKDDVRLALNLAIRPWMWREGEAVKNLEDNFRQYIGLKYACSFNSGRSSLYALLKSFGLQKGDKVLLQAFTCNAVPNPILWANLQPVYVDCNRNDFNIDVDDLRHKMETVNPKPKALVVQHTFGVPANMDEIMSIVRHYGLILIEDCAHSLGAEYKGQKVGTFGDASFFSFSRDKVISSVYGGMAATNNHEIAQKLMQYQKDFGQPPKLWIFQQILHPILLNYIILPLYKFLDLGKVFLVGSQILHILSKAVSLQEKRGQRPDYFPKALPNALAMMALHQLGKLGKFYSHREHISRFYQENLANTKFKMQEGLFNGVSKPSYLRFAVRHPDAHEIIYEAWNNQNILIGDWYTTCIAPFDTKLEEMKYNKGTCPNAESLAKQTLNLPTHINIKKTDAERIVNFLKNGIRRHN